MANNAQYRFELLILKSKNIIEIKMRFFFIIPPLLSNCNDNSNKFKD